MTRLLALAQALIDILADLKESLALKEISIDLMQPLSF